jgi:D-alanyl-lipoteichoic acid acyltransferase DltB (MBOAT superfamily)
VIFNTVSYIAFLAASTALFWLLPNAGRMALLLGASLLFYALWRVEFVFLIVFSALVDFFFSLKVHATEDARWRRAYMLLSISTNLGLLVYFKYTYFIIDNLALLPGVSAPGLKETVGTIILPLGISFYTFLSISYTIDVYRRDFVPIRSFAHYLTYVMFWPHMIAGPILRAHELIPQLRDPPRPSHQETAAGLRAIVFGLFLKVGLADHLAPIVDEAFAMPPSRLGGLDVWTMAFAFGLQIYFDFAGYSLIAIGSAQLLGVKFPDNFNWPYLATSPREFWRRWHITLSSWIRDYLYLPLSGLRERSHSAGGIDVQFVRSRNAATITIALFLTWLLMGLWHGASWNFALWGLWHASFIFAYRLASTYLPERPTPLGMIAGWAITLAVSMLGWIPFRAPTLESTFALFGRVFDARSYVSLGFRENVYLFVFCVFAGMLALHGMLKLQPRGRLGEAWRNLGEVAAVSLALFVVFIFLRPVAQFIYFQF